ncbi:TIGR00289 family protein, partial [archaeon]|nr:TIGR00289 family protein [archaeon]
GGEFESLVLDGPIFSKKLVLKEFDVEMESSRCGVLDVKKVVLE